MPVQPPAPEPAASPQVTLVVEGPGGREERRFAPGAVTVGRAQDNLLVLDDDSISRRHARIILAPDGLQVVDQGSTNGTFLNDTRLAQQRPEPFGPGDRIAIGPFTITAPNSGTLIAPRPDLAALMEATEMWAPGKSPLASPKPRRDAGAAREPAGDMAGLTGTFDLAGRTTVRIGRAPDNDIVLDHPQISRRHAVLEQEGAAFKLTDLGSSNGTFVNGQRITASHVVQEGDVVQFASFRLVLRGGHLLQFDDHANISVDALHLTKTVGKGRLQILSDVSLSVRPCEFVALVGGSGAGKTTLLDALNGFRPATAGTVLYNGADLYRNFDAYRNVIGYVPQDDIIHRELTVRGALSYAAQLRLPRDTSAQERDERIGQVLKDLNLEQRRDTPIGSLSGGQRKRVSIGVELLNKPSLLFLDEPTSGLDPSTETKMMRLLRELADQGHTVLLVTHVTANVSLCDKVAIMAPGGRLAFYGPPAEALAYFKVRDFVDIYDQLDAGGPEALKQQYYQSPEYQQYVAQPLSRYDGGNETGPARPDRVAPGFKGISWFRQLAILSRRNLEVLLRDRASLVLMLAIAPLLGLLDVFTWKANLFATEGGNSVQAITVLFITALDCVLVGGLASMREIVKETEIYRRERMVGLGIVPYLGSKVWLGIVLALYQALMFVLFKVLVISSLPHDPLSMLRMYVTLALTTLAGMVMGLFISAVSPNQNVAPLLTILLIVPQIIFGGGILPVTAVPNGETISKAMITKWGFDALVTISQIGHDVAADTCWSPAAARAEEKFHPPTDAQSGQAASQLLSDWQGTLTDDYKQANCACLGSNIFSKCRFPGITANYTAADQVAVNSAEPPQPAKPGPAPAQPASPPAMPASIGDQPLCNQADPNCALQLKDWQTKFTAWQSDMSAWSKQMNTWEDQMNAWKTQMDAYTGSANQYQDRMAAWQTAYKDWQIRRNKAIGSAEALVRKTYDDYGAFFQMDLLQAWAALGAIIAVLLALIVAAQKRKDLTAR